jgi:hypothetical protein
MSAWPACLAGEAAQHPGDLGGGHVLDEPQQAGTAVHWRPSGGGIVKPGNLPYCSSACKVSNSSAAKRGDFWSGTRSQ